MYIHIELLLKQLYCTIIFIPETHSLTYVRVYRKVKSKWSSLTSIIKGNDIECSSLLTQGIGSQTLRILGTSIWLLDLQAHFLTLYVACQLTLCYQSTRQVLSLC